MQKCRDEAQSRRSLIESLIISLQKVSYFVTFIKEKSIFFSVIEILRKEYLCLL